MPIGLELEHLKALVAEKAGQLAAKDAQITQLNVQLREMQLDNERLKAYHQELEAKQAPKLLRAMMNIKK